MTLLQMSLLSSAMILATAVVRRTAMNRLPKTTFSVLWAVILCRLLLPFSFSSPLSIYGIFQPLLSFSSLPKTVASATAPPQILTAPPTVITTPTVQQSLSFSSWFLLWVGGFLLCLLFFGLAYFRCHKELLTSLPVQNSFADEWLSAHPLKRTVSIRQSDKISAPLTYGLWRPVILLPSKTDWQNRQKLEYIFTHELVHIRRFDLLFKLLLALALCIHWFNPLVWIMYLLANRDLELSCDEQVLHILGEENKSLYAMTLLNMEEQRTRFHPLYSSFSKNSTQERIVSIMKIKKASLSGTLAALLVVTCITSAFAASPEKEASPQTELITVSETAQSPTVSETAQSPTASETDQSPSKYYLQYKPYGLIYEEKSDALFYKGKQVRCFEDLYPVDKENPEAFCGITYSNAEGTVDVHAVRDLKNIPIKADGSYDPSGTLIGVEAYSQKEFDERTRSLKLSPVQAEESVETENSVSTKAEQTSDTIPYNTTRFRGAAASDNPYSVSCRRYDGKENSSPYCYGRANGFCEDPSNCYDCPQENPYCLRYNENQDGVRPQRAGGCFGNPSRGCPRQ